MAAFAIRSISDNLILIPSRARPATEGIRWFGRVMCAPRDGKLTIENPVSRQLGPFFCPGQIPADIGQANAMALIHDHPAPFDDNRQSFIRHVIEARQVTGKRFALVHAPITSAGPSSAKRSMGSTLLSNCRAQPAGR